MAVWYSLWSFGIFFPFWYVWTKENLATLLPNGKFANQKYHLGKFRRAFEWKRLIYFWPFGIDYIRPFGTYYV
jgi:hypothetical protein